MTEKIGRKALFMGVSEKQEAESPPGEVERRVIGEFSLVLEAALSGNYSERIPETEIPDFWKSFAVSFNHLLRETSDIHREYTALLLTFEQSLFPMTIRYGSGREFMSNSGYRSLMEESARNDPVQFSILRMKETEMIEESGRQGSPVSQRICLPGAQGTGLEYRLTVIPLDRENVTPYFLLYMENLNEIAYFEIALGALERQVEVLRSRQNQILLENPLPILITDLGGNISTANEAFARISGISIPDTGVLAYSDLSLTESIGQNIEDIARYRKMGAAQVTFDFPSGMRTLWQYGVPVAGPEEKEQIVLIFFDITAQIDRERDLESQIVALKDEVRDLKKRQSMPPMEPAALPTMAQKASVAIPAGPQVSPKPPDSRQMRGEMVTDRAHDVVEFQLGGEKYALDINFAREIVEMMPITPIPRSPPYLRGVMNLRGEITNIITINSMLGLSELSGEQGRKIIVLSSEATGGENIGIVVDEVHSVIQIHESDVEHLGGGLTGQASGHIKGVIKVSGKGVIERKDEDEKDLIIWIDVQKLLQDLIPRK